MQIENIIQQHNEEEQGRVPFSGVVYYETESEARFEQAYGHANRSDRIANTALTRFGIASGCKIFTAVAICQLAERGAFRFDTPIRELGVQIDSFDPSITVHHLLTHTSGIPDYFDEEVMTDFEELWRTVPMYTMTSPRHFLPLFQDRPMKFEPGTRFAYNNAGFIVLGLIVEHVTGTRFVDYVQEQIFQACDMLDSGYFRMDRLPERTAIGYSGSGDDWKTNLYSLPIIGGPDGGAYTTVHDLAKFWRGLMENRLLSQPTTERMLTPHVQDTEVRHYGYGVWIVKRNDELFKYFVMGSDPGVVMQSSYYPVSKAQVHILANVDRGAGKIASRIDEALVAQRTAR